MTLILDETMFLFSVFISKTKAGDKVIGVNIEHLNEHYIETGLR